MEESSACLVRSFSLPSPNSSEEKKANPLQRALTTSISFGKFMSESLDWERWSAFTHNRYLEEVEKFSRPGSVAEKKAYFESHFKRRAAALLETQNATSKISASDFSEANADNKAKDYSSLDSDLAQRDNCVVNKSMTAMEVQPGGVKKYAKPRVLLENPVELTDHIADDECIDDNVSNKEDKACNKGDSSMRKSPSSSEKKPQVSSKFLPNVTASKCAPSVKQIMTNSTKTPNVKNGARDLSNKRRSYTKSLHMSINFASCSDETPKATSPVLPKTESSRPIRGSAKKHKNSTPPQTSAQSSVHGLFKHQLATPPAANRDITTTNGDSIKRSGTLEGKVQSLSTNKARLPTVASTFTFKREERAAKPKEFFQKLEQKLKSKQTEEQQPHANSQVKARNKFRDIHHSFALEATKNEEVPPTIELPSNSTKRIPTVRPSFPKLKESASSKIQDNHSRPPWGLSVKTQGLNDPTGKKNHPPICDARPPSKKILDGGSPNIQPLYR